MDTPLKIVEVIFKGMANADKFQAPDKDYANMMKESFEKDDPEAFYTSINEELQTMIEQEDMMTEEDIEGFLIDLGALMMLYTKHRDKTPPKKQKPNFKPAPKGKNTYKDDKEGAGKAVG